MVTNDPPSAVKTKERLTQAMIRMIGRNGLHMASVRAVAREAGCNEAMLYQHFKNKAEMQETIFEQIMQKMAKQKNDIRAEHSDFRPFFRTWINCTYESYDKDPDAFAYGRLSFPPVVDRTHPMLNSDVMILRDIIGELTPPPNTRIVSNDAKISIFQAALLGPPRNIHLGLTPGPATAFTDSVLSTAENIFLDPA